MSSNLDKGSRGSLEVRLFGYVITAMLGLISWFGISLQNSVESLRMESIEKSELQTLIRTEQLNVLRRLQEFDQRISTAMDDRFRGADHRRHMDGPHNNLDIQLRDHEKRIDKLELRMRQSNLKLSVNPKADGR